jgi:outer membrane receptor protein involved in Fe transport
MDDRNLFYAAASKGFRVGGGNAPLPDNCSQNAPGYKSDYVWSYEIGAKDKLLNDRLQLDTSAFYINWDKIQTLVVAQCGVAYTANAGAAVSKGFDFALQGVITSQLLAELAVGYVDAYFTQSVLDPFGNPLVQKGDKVTALPQVNPPWDVRAALNYETRIPGADNRLHLHGEYQYHSRNPGPFISSDPKSSNYAPLETADPPIHLVNARMGVTLNRLNLDLFVNNIFNSHPALGSFQLPATSNLVTYSTLRPRTLGLAVNYEF